MFKKAIIAAAAVAAIATGTISNTQTAEAGVSIHVGFGHGFSHGPWAAFGHSHHGYGHHGYARKCFWKKYPVKVKVWTHHGLIYKTVYKKKYICH